MRKTFYIVTALVMVASMLLAACGPTATPAATGGTTSSAAAVSAAPASATAAPASSMAASAPASATAGPTATLTPYPLAVAKAGFTQVRWYIGLGTGTDAGQLPIEQSVVDDFNADPARATDKIQLVMEVIPFASAKDTLSTEIAAGNGPDLVGPVGWSGSNAFFGQWLDIAPLIASSKFDTSVFDSSLVKMYQTGDQGTVGLPFAVYPSAMEFNTALFDQAGLKYPPAKYGDKYTMPDGSQVTWDWAAVQKVGQLLTVDSNGKNATETGFDKTKIVQYGFTWNFENQPEYWGAFWAGDSELVAGGAKGSYAAKVPATWAASWKWMYDGIWGDQPFIASNAVEQSADFGTGNPFNSGKVAMTIEPSWYTCCMAAVKTWDFAAMPTYNGKVGGRIDADTIRILKTTKNPAAAFTALTFLVTNGVDKLIVGSKGNPPAYGAVPAIGAKRQPFLDAAQANFPWVKNYATLMAGLAYPDVPSAEGYVPNFNDAWNRNQTFGQLLVTTSGLDLTKEEATLEADLTVIYNK